MSSEFGSAMSDRDALKAEYAARSAINLSRLLIASEPTVRQAAGLLLSALGGGGKPPQIPVWEYGDQILGAFNDADGAERFRSLSSADVSAGQDLGLDGAGFEVRIVDEDSKISLNAAARSSFGARDVGRQIMGLIGGPQYDALFERKGPDGRHSTRQDVCSAIIDWVDGNQDMESCDSTAQAQTAPPEDAYYRNLDDPYPRKNAPFDSLEELRLVRGVGDDFWATFIEPDPFDAGSRPVSVWSTGKININTAGPLTILSYVCSWAVPDTPLCNDSTGTMPAGFLSMMSLAQSMFSGVPVFRSPKQLRQALEGQGPLAGFLETAGIVPIVFLSPSGFEKGLALESKVFSIYAEGYVRQGKRETRVRIMSVVDFRKAPTVQDLVASALDNRVATPPPGSEGDAEETGAVETAISGALVPSTGGRVVYYRVN
jgi:general secretion pathway protein K